MAGLFYLSGVGRGGGTSKGGEEKYQENNYNSNNSSNNNNYIHDDRLYLYRNEEIYNKRFEIWPDHHHMTNYSTFGVGPSSNRRTTGTTTLNFSSSDDQSSRSAGFMRGFGGGGGMNCQDCGNQSKRDCPHMRCRACCKSRGFQCQTHVKSTWVAAAKRRERQQQQGQQQHVGHENPQRQRENINQAGASSSLACDTRSGN